MKKVIVLGGNGFLGKHVMSLLKVKKYEAVSISRHEGCDITNLKAFTKKLKSERPDAVVNCAAHVGSVHYAMQYSADMIRDNMQLIINIYEAVKTACPNTKIINPISNCSYPGDANIHYEPDWQSGPVHDSVLAYASTRRMIHAFAECFYRQYKINSVNWIIANAYGPGDHTDPNKVHALNGIIIRLLQAKKKGETTFEIWGSGRPTREWVYIEDAARILVDSIESIDNQIYPINLAKNKAHSITEIAQLAADILKYPVEFIFNTKYTDGAPTKILDNRQFQEKYTDFKFTPLEEGIKNTIKYYQNLI